jgi:hypothetical protein
MATKKKGNEPSINPAHKGRLHQALHIKGLIPLRALMKAENSSDAHIREMAQYADNARRWNHAKKK